jgi:hypothetical protein
MKAYKDKNGEVFFYEKDGSQDHLIGDKVFVPADQVQAALDALTQKHWDAQDYYRKRIHSYPELGEFVDAWVKNDQAALEEYRQKCLAVKAKYPKPQGF